MSDDVTDLANELRFTLRLGLIQPDSVARFILASAWRIQRDARIKAEALRDAADNDDPEFHIEVALGGSDDVRAWLRERADRIVTQSDVTAGDHGYAQSPAREDR